MSSYTERGNAAREEALAPINHQLPTEVQFTDLQGKDPEHTAFLSLRPFTRTGELGRGAGENQGKGAVLPKLDMLQNYGKSRLVHTGTTS